MPDSPPEPRGPTPQRPEPGTPGGSDSGPRIIPLRGARSTGAPMNGTPAFPEMPPPDGVEALYYEGMAAYQHRHWQEALDRFSRLKELQPSRPGLDALLDEVRWFLQLQAAVPANGATVRPVKQSAATRQGWRRQVRIALYAGLGVLAIAGLLLVAFGNRLPWRENRAAEDLYNRGQARLTVGDYEGAQAAFEKMLEIAPNDPEGLVGLDRAKRQQTLAQAYNAAQAAMTEEDWESAGKELATILAMDANYRDAANLSDEVSQMRRLAQLYADGGRLYDLGQWREALVQFEKVRDIDASYRAEAVGEFLFQCYLNAGDALLKGAVGLEGAQTAVSYFGQALNIHPRNRSAADARRLGSLYLEALEALARGDREHARGQLAALLAEAPVFAGGQAAQQLYEIYVAEGDEALTAGDVARAAEQFKLALALPVSDASAAQQGAARADATALVTAEARATAEAVARAATPTASPTPRNTATATAAPTPWATAGSAITLRAGPGSAYPVAGTLAQGVTVAVTGRREDGAWLRVCCTADGKEAWAPSSALDVKGPLNRAEVVKLPTPKPAPTKTPFVTATPKPRLCLQGNVLNTAGGDGLAGWTVRVVDAAGATFAQRTNASGFYRFTSLAAGPATVSFDVPGGWRPVSPTSSGAIIAAGSVCAVTDFWGEKAADQSPAAPPTEPIITPTPPR